MSFQQQLLLALLPPIATLAVVMIGFLYNNSRLSDLRADMIARFAQMDARMTEFQANLRELQRAQAEAFDAKLIRLKEMMLHKFAELGNRLTRIEHQLGL